MARLEAAHKSWLPPLLREAKGQVGGQGSGIAILINCPLKRGAELGALIERRNRLGSSLARERERPFLLWPNTLIHAPSALASTIVRQELTPE